MNEEGLNLVLKNENREIMNNMENVGMRLVENNNFFKDLSELMSDKKVTTFFDKYFKNMGDIKSTVIYMKLFRLFQKRYKDVSNEDLSKYVNIYLLHQAMTDSNIRRTLIRETMNHLENNSLPILNLTPEIVKKRKKKEKLKRDIERFLDKEKNKEKSNKKIGEISEKDS